MTIELEKKVLEKSDMAQRLWGAWAREEFTIHYQPQVDIATGLIEKFEALIRWEKADEPISPAKFIPIAEETGLIVPLGIWILKTVCEQLKKWNSDDGDFCGVSINFSSRQLQVPDFVQSITRLVKECGVHPGKLEIELTEQTFLELQEDTAEIFDQLRKFGITIALDDFGTGYSSLSYLQYFPIDTLKIDRSFIHNLQDNEKSKAIVKAILSIAHSLKIRTVAEGVERLVQLDFLIAERCDAVQGYLFSKPVPADEAYHLYVENRQLMRSRESVGIVQS